MSADEIVLEIEDTEVKCRKRTLIRNSEYFRVMFEGNFIERNMKKIKLQGVELKAMKIILCLLTNRNYALGNEDILMILHVADMLQFVEIFNLVLHKISKILCPNHCLKIWQATEQLSIKPLYLKAKSMALDKFMLVRETEYILELSLGRLCGYVGHVHLRADNEFSVFETIMNWWNANINKYLENCTVTLLKLLSCVDYRNLHDKYIRQIMNYSGISNNNTIENILLCLFNMKKGSSTDRFSQSCRDMASLLLNSTRSRSLASCPCILVRTECPYDDGFVDNFSQLEVQKTEFHILYYDYNSNGFKKFFEIDNEKCLNLVGFEILAFKDFIYLYGGQFVIGRGEFNYTIWIYDPIPENWKKRDGLPDPRRHFQSLIIDDRIYILGGTGNFRIPQDTLFWYNISSNLWSAKEALPFNGRQMKCCEYLNEFFVFSMNEKCGYFHTRDSLGNWTWEKKKLVMEDSIMNNDSVFELISYKDKLYIKGKKLIELCVDDDKLVIISIKNITNIDYDALKVIMCHNIIYTLYKYQNFGTPLYSLETYNPETGVIDFIFTGIDGVIELNNSRLQIHTNMNFFSFNHYSLVEKDNLINCSFL